MRPPSDLPRSGGLSRFGRRTRNVLVAAAALLVLGVVVGRWLARLVTDSWWFDSLYQRQVLSTISLVRVELGVVAGLTAACLLYGCLLVVDRTAPLERAHGHDDQFVARYQVLVAEHGLALRVIASIVFGCAAALPVVARWQQWLLFRHAVSFPGNDAVYGRNLSFYVFRLPFLTFVSEWAFTVLAIAALLSAAAHYLSGSIRLAAPRHAAPGVRVQLSALFVALALARAGGYWLHRYNLVTSTRGFVRGLGYVDEHHVRPALDLLSLVAVTTAALVVVGWRQRSWRLPAASAATWAVLSVTAGSLYPAVVQRLVADDQTATREHDGIVRNVAATRLAFGLDESHLTTEPVVDAAVSSPDDLANLAAVRLLSPSAARIALKTADAAPGIARIVVGGAVEQVYVGVPTAQAASGDAWAAKHQIVLDTNAPSFVQASTVSSAGYAALVPAAGKIDPATGPVLVDETSASYGILTGADRNRTPDKLASVDLSSFGRRLAFALRFGDLDLVRKTTNQDQVLYVRRVTDRVRTLAPFLAWDSDPYPVVAGGRLQWVVDGYTTTDAYPSSERADVSGLPRGSGLRRSFNYVRNPVKALVDAHSGAVSLYVFDDADPVLIAWRDAFPSLFKAHDALPAGVDAQIRYPIDLLTVQAAMWGAYRNDDVQGDQAAYFAGAVGRWTPAPIAAQSLVPIAPIAATPSTAPTTAKPPTSTTTASANAGGSRVVGPTYAMWDAKFVAVAPMVAARAGSASQLAALVTGSTGVDGVPRLTVYRTDTEIASPAAARAAIVQEVRTLAPSLPDGSFGELQAVRVGDGMAWVLPWYKPATAQLDGVGLLTPGGTVRLGVSIEAAARAAYRMDPGFTTVEGATATTGPWLVPPGMSVAELQGEARELYRQAQEQFNAGDVRAGFATLDHAYQYLRRAADAQPSAPVTAAPGPTTTASPTTTVGGQGWTA